MENRYDDEFFGDYDDYEEFDDYDERYAPVARYTVIYDGYLFDGDSDGVNMHHYDDFKSCIELYYAYGDMIEIEDNIYGVTFSHGSWN